VEFIELYNAGSETLDLSGVYFSDGIEFAFPTGSLLEPGAYVVLTQDQALFETVYPGVPLSGVYTDQLSNGGETLEISAPDDSVILAMSYNDTPPWPTAADGQGFSLVVADVFGSPGDAANWRPSTGIDGSPGTGEVPSQIPAVLVNEILTHTDLPGIDTIEIHNPTNAEADLRGWFLTDDRMDPQRARIPSDTAYVLPPGGYAVLDEYIFRDAPGSLGDTPLPGFALSALGGEDVYLFSA
ncbi:MAG: lamin tail domain-containing protein, partial [bacterium]|nr:lamin tail domain-containing protein [bacterium]